MKSTTPKVSVIKPPLKKLINQHGANSKAPKQNSKAGSAPLKPAGLAQDLGAGYNSDNTSCKAKQPGRTSTSALPEPHKALRRLYAGLQMIR
jgi:hypothetical protein